MQFGNDEDFEVARAFFIGKRRDFCATVAVRAALRVLPVVWGGAIYGWPEWESTMLLPVVHALGAAHGAAQSRALWKELIAGINARGSMGISGDTGHRRAYAAAFDALAASAAGIDEMMPNDGGYLIPFAAAYAVHEAANAVTIIAATPARALTPFNKAFWQDVAQLQGRVSMSGVSAVCASPLWPDGMPIEIALQWQDMKAAFIAGGDIPVWLAWFEDRLHGRVSPARDERLAGVWVDAVIRDRLAR